MPMPRRSVARIDPLARSRACPSRCARCRTPSRRRSTPCSRAAGRRRSRPRCRWIRPVLDRQLDRRLHVRLEREDDVAGGDHDLAVDAVVGAAGEQEAGRPVVPAPGRVGVPVLRDDRVGAELVGDVGAGGVREAQRLAPCRAARSPCSTRSRSVARREHVAQVLDAARCRAGCACRAPGSRAAPSRTAGRSCRSRGRPALSASIAGWLPASGVAPTSHAPTSPSRLDVSCASRTL